MFDEGWTDIVNIDISLTVITQMIEHYKQSHYDMKNNWDKIINKQMDVRNLDYFDDETFHAVIDKGTFDSVCCGDAAEQNAKAMCEEISRVLQPGGTYICVSYGMKEIRTLQFNKPAYNWDVKHEMVPKPTMGGVSTEQAKELAKDEKNMHHVYIMKKKSD